MFDSVSFNLEQPIKRMNSYSLHIFKDIRQGFSLMVDIVFQPKD